jgi:hypothetical protein
MIRNVESAYAWPGGYPVFALMKDSGCLCPKCVTENRGLIYRDSIRTWGTKSWTIVAAHINWEDMELSCDNCYMEIECAYPDESNRQYQQ